MNLCAIRQEHHRVVRWAALLAAGTTLALAACLPSPAAAEWTAAQTVPGSSHAGDTSALAVNSRGHLAVAWIAQELVNSAGKRTMRHTVRAATRRAGSKTFSTRTLAIARGRRAMDIAVAVDNRGETTVAWTDSSASARRLRAAFRTAAGAWSRVQTIGSTLGFDARPRLAVAPNGTFVVTASTRTGSRLATRGVGAAWRSRGKRFGRARAVRIGRSLLEPTLAFDPAGTAYLAGIRADARGRGRSGIVFTATTHGRRFGPARVIAPGAGRGLRFVVTGRGSAVAAWLDGADRDEGFAGVPMTAALHAGRITAPVKLGDPRGIDIQLATAPAGAEASWLVDEDVRSATIALDGTPQPVQTRTDGWLAVAGDRDANQLVAQIRVASPGVLPGARRASGGAVELAPFPATGSYWPRRIAAAADGSALAVMDIVGLRSRIVTSVWLPLPARGPGHR